MIKNLKNVLSLILLVLIFSSQFSCMLGPIVNHDGDNQDINGDGENVLKNLCPVGQDLLMDLFIPNVENHHGITDYSIKYDFGLTDIKAIYTGIEGRYEFPEPRELQTRIWFQLNPLSNLPDSIGGGGEIISVSILEPPMIDVYLLDEMLQSTILSPVASIPTYSSATFSFINQDREMPGLFDLEGAIWNNEILVARACDIPIKVSYADGTETSTNISSWWTVFEIRPGKKIDIFPENLP